MGFEDFEFPVVTRYALCGDKVMTMYLRKDGLWEDDYGCILAISELNPGDDPKDRCGVGVLSLPVDHPLTDACRAHDFAYSSKAFQLYHTRSEADTALRKAIKEVGGSHWYARLALPFYRLVRTFGGRFWENKNTR